MITKSLKLNLKLVYQLTHRTMICPSKCRPLNSASTGPKGCILPSSPERACLHQNPQADLQRGKRRTLFVPCLDGCVLRVKVSRNSAQNLPSRSCNKNRQPFRCSIPSEVALQATYGDASALQRN